MFNRIAFAGSYSKFFFVNIYDVTKRELYMLLTLVTFTVVLGIYPNVLLDGIHYSVSTLIYDMPVAMLLFPSFKLKINKMYSYKNVVISCVLVVMLLFVVYNVLIIDPLYCLDDESVNNVTAQGDTQVSSSQGNSGSQPASPQDDLESRPASPQNSLESRPASPQESVSSLSSISSDGSTETINLNEVTPESAAEHLAEHQSEEDCHLCTMAALWTETGVIDFLNGNFDEEWLISDSDMNDGSGSDMNDGSDHDMDDRSDHNMDDRSDSNINDRSDSNVNDRSDSNVNDKSNSDVDDTNNNGNGV